MSFRHAGSDVLHDEIERLTRERDEARESLRDVMRDRDTMREAAERAEVACAAMRAALEKAPVGDDFTSPDEWVAHYMRKDAALAADAGRAVTERLERYERALRAVHDEGHTSSCHALLGAPGTRCDCVWHIARTALAEKGK